MYVIGVDPGQRTGIVLMDAETEEIIYADSLKQDNRGLGKLVSVLGFLRGMDDLKALCVESQYVAANKKTAMSIARSSGFWTGAICALIGCVKPVMITPREWQHGVLDLKFGDGRDEIKQQSRLLAADKWPGICKSDDECDAAAIALYYIRS